MSDAVFTEDQNDAVFTVGEMKLVIDAYRAQVEFYRTLTRFYESLNKRRRTGD